GRRAGALFTHAPGRRRDGRAALLGVGAPRRRRAGAVSCGAEPRRRRAGPREGSDHPRRTSRYLVLADPAGEKVGAQGRYRQVSAQRCRALSREVRRALLLPKGGAPCSESIDCPNVSAIMWRWTPSALTSKRERRSPSWVPAARE